MSTQEKEIKETESCSTTKESSCSTDAKKASDESCAVTVNEQKKAEEKPVDKKEGGCCGG